MKILRSVLIFIVSLNLEAQAQASDERGGSLPVRDQCTVAENHVDLQHSSNNACGQVDISKQTLRRSMGPKAEFDFSPNPATTRSILKPRLVDDECEIIRLSSFDSCEPELCAAHPAVTCRIFGAQCRGAGLSSVPHCHGCKCLRKIPPDEGIRIDNECEIVNRKRVESCRPEECSNHPSVTCRRFGKTTSISNYFGSACH